MTDVISNELGKEKEEPKKSATRGRPKKAHPTGGRNVAIDKDGRPISGFKDGRTRDPGGDGRVPLYKANRIGIDHEPGFHTHLITDRGERISSALKGGYTFVGKSAKGGRLDAGDASQEGSVASQVVNPSIGEKGYYMKIPIEYYEEDQKGKQARADEIMAQIGFEQKGMLDAIPQSFRVGRVLMQDILK